jgi:formate dehydrogenase major subunit
MTSRAAWKRGLGAQEGGTMTTHRVRLTQPLVREDGTLRPASWDEAIGRAARGLREAVDRGGGQGVGVFSCSKATNEVNFIAQKFIRQALASNNIDSCNRT